MERISLRAMFEPHHSESRSVSASSNLFQTADVLPKKEREEGAFQAPSSRLAFTLKAKYVVRMFLR